MKTNAGLVVVSIAALLTASGTSEADTKYFTGDAGPSWHANGNWLTGSCAGSPSTEPTSADDVVICPNVTPQITGAAVAKTVNGGQIDIAPDGADATLTLGSSSASELQSNAGMTLFEDTDCTPGVNCGVARVVITAADHAFVGGFGRIIEGQDNLAEIVIGAGLTLRNTARVVGRLKIVSGTNGEFLHNGKVTAAGTNGQLVVAPYILTCPAGVWAAAGGGTLEFSAAIDTVTSAFAGDFSFTDGSEANSKIVINRQFVTLGRLQSIDFGTLVVNESFTMGSEGFGADFDGGTIIVAADRLFRHH